MAALDFSGLVEKVKTGKALKDLEYGPLPPIPTFRDLVTIIQQGQYLFKHHQFSFADGQAMVVLLINWYLHGGGNN